MSSVKFAALNTKIRAIKGTFLTSEDYENLMDLGTVEDVYSYLRTKDFYKELFKKKDVNLEAIEGYLHSKILEIFTRLNNYIDYEYKNLFKSLMRKFEIENIKTYLRVIIRNDDVSKLYLNYEDVSFYSDIDYKKLSESSDLSEFVENLKDTMYYDVLKMYLGEEKDRILFYMEMNLDRKYFSELYKSLSVLKRDEQVILDILKVNIDFLNVQWIYRGRKYFHLSSEEVLNYSLSFGKYINYDRLKEFSYMDDEEELFESFKKIYPNVFIYDSFNKLYLARDLYRYLDRLFDSANNSKKSNVIMLIWFMHKVEYKMKDFFSIIESKFYNMTKEEIKEYLILGG